MLEIPPIKSDDSELLRIIAETWKAAQLLREPLPDTFLGRKTQEPFPKEHGVMDKSPTNLSYRSLEWLCRQQARLSAEPARNELECMALEYKRIVDWQQKEWPEADRCETKTPAKLPPKE